MTMRFSSRSAGSAGAVTVADQAAMLASGASPGQFAYREDDNTTYVLLSSPASTLGNWQSVVTAAVSSGRVGLASVPEEVAALAEIPNLSPFLLGL